MTAVPAATPVITPVLPAVTIPVLLLLHTPPAVASLNVVLIPAHTLAAPEILEGVAGNGFTVIGFLA